MKYFLIILLFSLLHPATIACAAVTVSTVGELVDAVSSANSGGDGEVLIQPGTYNLDGAYLRITADNVTITGLGESRGDVVLDGGYDSLEIFQIVASHVQIRNLTMKRAYYHPIHAMPSNSNDSIGIVIDNVHIIDSGQQAIKINQNSDKKYSVNHGTISNSLIELTDAGREQVWTINGSCYTGGVDGHHATGWQIRDNEIRGFWCSGGLAEHGVHFWSESQDTLVERNKIIDCDRGIGFGLNSSAHFGGIIRNNMIYHGPDHGYSDVGIGLESASNINVYNNTIYHEHPYANGIEYRFAVSNDNHLVNNLTNKLIVSRQDGRASLSHNVTTAQADWFVEVESGDLHLVGHLQGVVDSGVEVTDLLDDLDQQPRFSGDGIDIGADELYPTQPPSSPISVISFTSLLLLK